MPMVARAKSAGDNEPLPFLRSTEADLSTCDGVLAGLDALGQAGCLLDRAWRVLAANTSGERFVAEVFATFDGGVIARTRAIDLRLERLRSLEPGFNGVAMLSSDTRPAIIVRALRLAVPIGAVHTILTFSDCGDASLPCEATVRQAFGLTATEAEIAIAIARGVSLNEIATSRGIRRETVRTHLRTVFDKTGTRRQAALAILLVRLQPLAGRTPQSRI